MKWKDPSPDLSRPSIYDPADAEEDDLWFLPPPDEEDGETTSDLPWKVADRTREEDAQDWAVAEASLSLDLARAASLLGALDDRLRRDQGRRGGGLSRRLARMEAAELSWHLGDRVPLDRLSLWLALRLSAVGEDPQALERAAWAVRRLEGSGVLTPEDPGTLAPFLAREAVANPAEPELMGRPLGSEFAALADHWSATVQQGAGLHPLTRAALSWHLWRGVGLSGDTALIEGAVVAARIGVAGLRGGLLALPLGLAGPSALRSGGAARDRLADWYKGVARAAQAALMECDRLEDWRDRAGEAISDLSGRTPPRLVEAIGRWPLVSAPMLEHEIGASRAAVQRNMNLFQERGLVREVTGQNRYRFWSARV